jgi:hypothetical protein
MEMRMIAAALIAITLASSEALSDPFSDLTKHGGAACFRRDYDATHLKKNPRQQTTAMTLWIAGKGEMESGNIGLALTRRTDPQPLFLSGDCAWDNFKSPPEWMPSFAKKAGAGCVTSAIPDVFPESSSAEEGGPVILDPSADGKTMIVHLDDSPSLVRRAERWKVIPLKLGRDDRVFLLRRTAPKDCDFVKEAVTTPEPAAPQGRPR